MNYIFNEYKHIEEVEENYEKFTERAVNFELGIYARYLNTQQLEQAQKENMMCEYLDRHFRYPKKDGKKWGREIQHIIKENKDKTPFVCDEGIPVTQKELETIAQLDDATEKKVMFALLVFGKWGMIRRNSQGWINDTIGEIFKAANETGLKAAERMKMLGKFKSGGLLTEAQKIDNLSVKLTFYDDGDAVVRITDMRNLGHQYSEIAGLRPVYHCPKCGLARLISGWCSDCLKRKNAPKKVMTYHKIEKICVDCGKPFPSYSCAGRQRRCAPCQKEHAKKLKREKYWRWR